MDDLRPTTVRRAYRASERTEFAVLTDDEVWCALRGSRVPVVECATSCGAPEMQPRCWGVAMSQGDADGNE